MKLTRREVVAYFAGLPLVTKVEVEKLTDDDLLVLTVDRELPTHPCDDVSAVRDATIMMLKGQCGKFGITRYLIIPKGVEAHMMRPVCQKVQGSNDPPRGSKEETWSYVLDNGEDRFS